MPSPVVNSGGVDVWTDLMIACLVVFVVLAPAFFFRVPEDAEAAVQASTPARASIYYHSRGSDSHAQAYRRRAEVQQRPSASRAPSRAKSTSNGNSDNTSNKSATTSPTCEKKKAL
ncbi:uncharacterized protein IUM83_09842 [Phytophthora cinnamomi]|uniref:uncharacterized protein n=1 Tax=Phytophthora cinnamomi TaxID=4785 RepID=UPI003559B928|nr:hypothetical protein IUM83_09842 [Phytophthora cinnamomi]